MNKKEIKNIPLKAGFYLVDGSSCPFADSKQITKDLHQLQHDLYYRAIDGRVFKVKKGFIHDGASKLFLRHFGKYTNSAILHDALYASEILSRSEADNLFLEAMQVQKVSYLRRYTYYWAVRGFGGNVWKNHTLNQVKEAKKYIQIYTKEKK